MLQGQPVGRLGRKAGRKTWEPDSKGRSRALCVPKRGSPGFAHDSPTVRRNDLFRERQSEPGASFLRGVKQIEHPSSHALRHTHPRIMERELNAAVLATDLHTNRPTIFHRLASVPKEIEKRLPELTDIEGDRRKHLRRLDIDLNPREFELS